MSKPTAKKRPFSASVLAETTMGDALKSFIGRLITAETAIKDCRNVIADLRFSVTCMIEDLARANFDIAAVEKDDACALSAARTMQQTLRNIDKYLANTNHPAEHPWRTEIARALAKASGHA